MTQELSSHFSYHFVTSRDKISVPVASSLSDVSDYAYLTIPSIITQVSHVCHSGCQGKTFPRTPRAFLSENSAGLSGISTLVIDNRASTCRDSVARCTCASRDMRAQVARTTPNLSRDGHTREAAGRRSGDGKTR